MNRKERGYESEGQWEYVNRDIIADSPAPYIPCAESSACFPERGCEGDQNCLKSQLEAMNRGRGLEVNRPSQNMVAAIPISSAIVTQLTQALMATNISAIVYISISSNPTKISRVCLLI